MRLLSEEQRQAISDAIRDHHLAFKAEVLGRDSISREDYDRLVAAGKIRRQPTGQVSAASRAYLLGHAASTVGHDAMMRADRQAAVPEIPLTSAEQEAVEIARDRIGALIVGLGNRVDAATGRIMIEADSRLRQNRLSAVRREVARGIERRETAQQVATNIRRATDDAKSDWRRIAQTEMHNALEEGKAAAFARQDPDGDPLVFKRPRPDSCPFCRLLYTENGIPRIFRLSQLVANGSNYDRKARRPTLTGKSATEWKATLGAMHPWCACTLHYLPAGFAFKPDGSLHYIGQTTKVQTLDKALLDHGCIDG